MLITGCSDGSTVAVVVQAFHKAGHKVWATARNPAKMEQLGIETLGVLVNNAGSQFLMPVVDVNIAEAKKLSDLKRGGSALLTRTTTVLPSGLFDGFLKEAERFG